MKAKDFEEVCLYRMRQHEERGDATMSRYGVQASYREEKWQPIQSLPDFEGVLLGGHQFIIEAKVCSQHSFPLHDDRFKRRQLKHLLIRSRFGVICCLLIHFNERVLKRTFDEESTWAFPVQVDHPFWNAFDRGEKKAITRGDCEEYGVKVEWNALSGGRKIRPDILKALYQLHSENPMSIKGIA